MKDFEYLWLTFTPVRAFKNKVESDKIFCWRHTNYSSMKWYNHWEFYKEAENMWCWEYDIFKLWEKNVSPWEKWFFSW
jgi:hypothetical protein